MLFLKREETKGTNPFCLISLIFSRMAIDECKDIENGLEKPFLENAKIVDSEYEQNQDGSIRMVLLSTFVAVCGSFEFGSCVSISIFIFIFPFYK